MHATFRILLLAPAMIGWAAADLPRKAPVSKYSGLWMNSPFTSKPPPPEQGPEVNPLEDYALSGVSPIPGGYRVTLLNRKKPEERVVVDSGKPSGGFKILGVTRKPGNPLGTIVRLSSGSVTGSVAFDESLLTLTPPPAAAKPPQQPPPGAQLPPGMQPPQPGQIPQRQARPRVVPPPATPNRPQGAASPQPAQPAQPNLPIPRPDRRRR